MVLQVSKNPSSSIGAQRSEDARVTQDTEPLDRTQEHSKLAQHGGGAIAQSCFYQFFKTLPALLVQLACFRYNRRNNSPKNRMNGRQHGHEALPKSVSLRCRVSLLAPEKGCKGQNREIRCSWLL